MKRANSLDEEGERIGALRAPLLASVSDIDAKSNAIEFQRSLVDHHSKRSVDAFNALVESYNAAVVAGKAKQADFNTIVNAHNLGVDSYNTDCAKRYYADDLEEAKKMASTN